METSSLVLSKELQLSLSPPNGAFPPLLTWRYCLQAVMGCGCALCSFSEHAVSWQLVFVPPHTKATVSLKETNKSKMLKKGDGVTVENTAVCQ